MFTPPVSAPQRELARLRARVLTGRGAGATVQEVAAHTRDRRWLGALPTPLELERVAHQTTLARLGATFASSSVLGRLLERTVGIVVGATAAALIARSILRGLAPAARTWR